MIFGEPERQRGTRYTIKLEDVIKYHPDFWNEYNIDLTGMPENFDFKILFERHYRFREIGFDTVAKFAHFLNDDIQRSLSNFIFFRNRQRALILEADPEVDFSTTTTSTLGSTNDSYSNSRPLTQKSISDDMLIDGLSRNVSSGGDSNEYKGRQRSNAAILTELIAAYHDFETSYIDSFDSLFMGVF